MKQNLVAFSLYGSAEIYSIGAIANARSLKDYYPDWTAIFYCGKSVSVTTMDELLKLKAMVVKVDEPENYSSSSWRFRAALLPEVQRVIFRDCDSRFSVREAKAVEAWVLSGKPVHVMRDHPNHIWDIQAGMFGVMPDGVPRFLEDVRLHTGDNYYGQDQDFLRKSLFKPYKKKTLIHDDISFQISGQTRFPQRRIGYSFVGEIIEADGRPQLAGRQLLEKFEKSWMFRVKTQTSLLKHRLADRLSDFLGSNRSA